MARRRMAELMDRILLSRGNMVTPLGDFETTWQALLEGKSGLKESKSHLAHAYPLGEIAGLQGAWGSWDRLKSLLDLLLADLPRLPSDSGLILATTKGAVDELLTAGARAKGQPWQLADYLRARLFLHGPAVTVSGACASGSMAVAQAAVQIMAGKCQHVLVIALDLLSRFVLTGFDSLKALAPERPRPFDRKRQGLALGEAGAWLLISDAQAASDWDFPPLASLKAWGINCDAVHITAPCRAGSGLRRLLAQLLQGHRLPGGINAHGTATVYNDAMEIYCFEELFAGQVPFCSVKGALGHSLGATGLVETLLSCLSLRDGCLPPTIGLQSPEHEGLPVSGSQALHLKESTVLTCNSGFGGINAALLLGRTEQLQSS